MLCLISLAYSVVYASEKPLWELGLGLGGLHQPCYVGTNQGCTNVFPVVLPVYRGEFLKSDEKGIRAELLEDHRFRFDVSADFNFAVDSDEIDSRDGMPDIGNLLQLGPTLEVTGFKDEANHLYFSFPLRIVFEIDDFDVAGAGYNFAPGLVFRRQLSNSSWRLSSSIAAQFRTHDFNALYYSVEPQFATEQRPAYRAGGGFSGTRLQLALSSNMSRNLWVFFIRYDSIEHAVFADSPLIETKSGFTGGFLYSRYLLKSKKTVIQSGW